MKFMNKMIFNAIIHNPQEVRVDVSVYEKDKVHILIKDNGMAISKQIIDAQGGSINVESTLGKGTNIDIVL